jgi:hypothetical protein
MAVDELVDLVKLVEPSFYENPVPIYQRLQQEAPTFYYAPLDIYVLTKHEDIRFAAQRKDIFSPTGGLLLTEIMHTEDTLLREEFFDPAGELFPYTADAGVHSARAGDDDRRTGGELPDAGGHHRCQSAY